MGRGRIIRMRNERASNPVKLERWCRLEMLQQRDKYLEAKSCGENADKLVEARTAGIAIAEGWEYCQRCRNLRDSEEAPGASVAAT